MKTLKNVKLVVGTIMMMLVSTQFSVAQTYNLNKTASTLKVEGTSNIHDWEVEAKDQNGKMVAELADGQLVKISQLEFTVKAESLKSGKSGMDKNTYKALNTNKHKEISYKLSKVNNIDCITAGSCKVTTSGTLTVAGTTKPVDITFDVKVKNNNIIVTGSISLKMTEFKIDPPTAVLGTIKTGDQVKIKFQSTFSK